jgi:hypothetical protein
VAASKPVNPETQLFSVPSPDYEVRSRFSSGRDYVEGTVGPDTYWVKGQQVSEQEYKIFQSAPIE